MPGSRTFRPCAGSPRKNFASLKSSGLLFPAPDVQNQRQRGKTHAMFKKGFVHVYGPCGHQRWDVLVGTSLQILHYAVHNPRSHSHAQARCYGLSAIGYRLSVISYSCRSRPRSERPVLERAIAAWLTRPISTFHSTLYRVMRQGELDITYLSYLITSNISSMIIVLFSRPFKCSDCLSAPMLPAHTGQRCVVAWSETVASRTKW